MASQTTGVSIVYSTVCSWVDQRKQSSVSLAFVRGIHRWPVNSPHKGPVTRKMLPFDDIIMRQEKASENTICNTSLFHSGLNLFTYYSQWHHWYDKTKPREYISVKFDSKFQKFSFKIASENFHLRKNCHFFQIFMCWIIFWLSTLIYVHQTTVLYSFIK